MPRLSLLIAPILLCAAPLAGQGASRYLPVPDTVYYETTNPHLMYWVVDGDTLGGPIHDVAIERHVWLQDTGALRVEVMAERLHPKRETDVDTFTIHPDGRVARVNGQGPGMHVRVDLLPRLPDVPLSEGVEWGDTLSTTRDGPAGDHAFRMERTYRVRAMFDSAGARYATVEVSGTVRYRDGWWVNPEKTIAVWIDVEGPVRELFTFDVSRGLLVNRAWAMELRGEGSIPHAQGGSQRVPAGLLSRSSQRIVDPARVAAVRQDPPRALQPVPDQ